MNVFVARCRLFLHQLAWPRARKLVAAVLGITLILMGLGKLILPRPAILVILLGIAILASEFRGVRRRLKRIGDLFSNQSPVKHMHGGERHAQSKHDAPPSAHTLSVQSILDTFSTDPSEGLNSSRIEAFRRKHGFNELEAAPAAPCWKRFAGQFHDLVIWVLLAAAVISAAAGQWIDACVILAIVILNGVLGFMQEERAGRALAALKNLVLPQARVIRDRQLRIIPARELVPGDRIELEAGDQIPGDARLIASNGLRVLEAALTGESTPGDKDHRPILPQETPLGERSNLVHMGTLTAAGLAAEFAEIFDGFSIGSNDLTQLILGVDRDSEIVAHVFDERNPAVKKMIAEVIRVAKAKGRKIGICGQAPSDYPQFAQFLAEQGIDSISLNPDTVLKTTVAILETERALAANGGGVK